MPHDTQKASPALGRFVSDTGLAPRQDHKLLSLWPLAQSQGAAVEGPDYVTLASACKAGTFRIEELEGGHVPRVAAVNEGTVAVLVLFGEEIQGALQNRTANASFLVAPKSRVVLDVSCVEQGRWNRRGAFQATSELVSSDIRRKMARRVAQSRARGGRFDSDQGEVWQQVSERLAFAQADSRTASYADYRDARRHDLDEVSRAFRPVDDQVGFVVTIGGEIVGLEAIGRPEVFAQAFPGLLRAYVIDAVDAAPLRARRQRFPTAPRFEAPEPFLAALAKAPSSSLPSLGLGDDIRIAGSEVCGCALVAGSVVHATAFPSEQEG